MTVGADPNGTPSASHTAWVYIVPNATMRCSLLLGRDDWTCFHSRSYQILPLKPDGRGFTSLTFVAMPSAVPPLNIPVTVRHQTFLTTRSKGVSLDHIPQLIPVNLVRLSGSPAITGHSMVDMPPRHDDSDPCERFVFSCRQSIPLSRWQ